MSDTKIISFSGWKKNALQVVMILIVLFWLIPVVSALYRSFRFMGIQNYVHVLSTRINGIYFVQAILNSFIIAGVAVTLTVSVSSLAGFCFSKIDFKLNRLLYLLTLCLLAIPGVTISIPLFFTIKNLNLMNTHLAVALPEVALTLPFGVLLMRNSFDAIDNAYLEAATIDGASYFQAFIKIYFPMNIGTTINLAILQFIWSFQDFLLPNYFISKKEIMTTTQLISSFNRAMTVTPKDLGAFSASLVLLSLPILVIYLIFSRYIKSGLTSGGLKG